MAPNGAILGFPLEASTRMRHSVRRMSKHRAEADQKALWRVIIASIGSACGLS